MPKTWSDVIWKAAVPPKISFFMWKLFHDAIPIDSKISQCGVQLASCCNCCTSSKCEDINHLLVDSELANYIWHSMSRIFVFSLFPNESIKARLMRICSRRYRSSLVGELTKVVPLIICWEILKERCNRRYDNKASSSITILKRVVNDLQDCSFLSKPSKDATHAEEIVLSCLNIQPKCYQQRKKIIVKWLKIPSSWILTAPPKATQVRLVEVVFSGIIEVTWYMLCRTFMACPRQSLWSILSL